MNKLSPFRFKPSKKFIFSQKTRNSNLYNLQFRKSHSFSSRRKVFNTIVPVKPFTRFIKPKIYGTGADPSTTFLHFMNKDCEKPYKKQISPIITQGIDNPPPKNIKWSIGTTYKCNNKEYLPKVDPFKEYYFHSRNNDELKNDKYITNYSSRDKININMNINNNIDKNLIKNKTLNTSEKKFDLLKMKKKFNFNSESESFWSPYVIHNDNNNFNRSSVHYNIINNKENKISGKKEISIIEKTVNNKKKGVTEFFHLQRNYEPNYSPKFSLFYKENRNGFMKYKGIFTDLYDSCNKNGNIYQPFKMDKGPQQFNRRKKLSILI